MKSTAKKTFIFACSLFVLTSCDPERNKASLGNSADTLHTDNAKHKYQDGTLKTNADSTGAAKDSGTSSGNADPSGRIQDR